MNPNRKVHNRPALKNARRYLRNNPTPEEALLWKRLKGKQLSGRKFRRQHSIDIWIMDFYCPIEKIVIELDGRQHYEPKGKWVDEIRDLSFEVDLGIRVLRFPNHRVRNDIEGVLWEIMRHIKTPPPK